MIELILSDTTKKYLSYSDLISNLIHLIHLGYRLSFLIVIVELLTSRSMLSPCFNFKSLTTCEGFNPHHTGRG